MEQAAQSGWTQYVYTAATPTIKPNVIVRQRDNGSETAAILAVSQVVFDDFGRVYQELRTMPDGSTSKRQTAYDGVGNKSTVSEVMTGNSHQCDDLQRLRSFRPAGNDHAPGRCPRTNVTMAYHGVRQVDRTVKIGTTVGSETASTTTEIYDRQGRLFSVAEPSGSGGALVTTTYGYDVGNRLSSVSTPGQSRSFVYDRAGLLQSETHPEKGVSGNGTVTYTGYDAAGDALRKTDGPNDLAFVYDPEERLLQVNEASGLSRPLKSFTYASSNATNDLRQGKLWQDSRYNYFTLGGSSFTARIDETYVYGGRDGRISSRTTGSSTGESFTQSFSYTALGLPDTITYPSCTHAACTATPAPARTVQNTYVQGLLTGVSANGTSYGTISYYPNLLVSQVVHRNGVTDTQGNDPFSMHRPSSAGAAGPSCHLELRRLHLRRLRQHHPYRYLVVHLRPCEPSDLRNAVRRSHGRRHPEDAELHLRFLRQSDQHRRHQCPCHAHQQRHQSSQRSRHGLRRSGQPDQLERSGLRLRPTSTRCSI